MVAKLFDEILLDGIRKGQVPARSKSARDWYRNQAKGISKGEVSSQKIMKESSERFTTQPIVGNMYMYVYDPKHKKTLPYYDKFPLVFPIGKAKGGFLGLNMHYLPLPLRAKLMDALYNTVNNKNFDEKTKLKISYSILNSAAKFNMFKPTIKHYLRSHIRTKFVLVHPTEWDIALFLPTARFEKATQTKVWKDSRKIIRGK